MASISRHQQSGWKMPASRDVSLLASTDSSFETHCTATVLEFKGFYSGRKIALPNFDKSTV